MANRCWLNRIRDILLPASCVHTLPHHHDRSLLLSLHSSQSSPSPPWLARCLSFKLVQRDMTTPFFALLPGVVCTCLSHTVSDSDVYASVSVSCSRSGPLTSAGVRSCGVPPGSIPLSHSRSAFPSHVSHTPLAKKTSYLIPGGGPIGTEV